MTLAADNSPLRVIYGLDRLPARVANALIYEGKLLLQVVWGEGVIEGVQSVTIGDVAMPASVTATHYTGTSGQTVDATMVAAADWGRRTISRVR